MSAAAPPTLPTAPGPGPFDLDALVSATPDHRYRPVDALRAGCIAVVVLWHWTLSITHPNRSGALTMPNPIDAVPGLWTATWVLQVMPLFFVVGGYANLAAWEAMRRRGGTWRTFAVRRTDRLVRPIGCFVATWAVADTAIRTLRPGTPSVLEWGRVVFVPLWFLGMYLGIVLLAPLTARLHRRHGVRAAVGLGLAVVVVDIARFAGGIGSARLVNSALVWLFAHQLGYLWRDGLVGARTRRRPVAVALAGFAALSTLVVVGPYARSMVAVRGGRVSNMFPTTACIAALALFQLGLVLLALPHLERVLAGRRAWKATVAVNAVAMTVFTWHMTALVFAIGAWHLLGQELSAEPTTTWWLQRPVWLLLPGVFLAGLLAVFARIELPGRRRSSASA